MELATKCEFKKNNFRLRDILRIQKENICFIKMKAVLDFSWAEVQN